MQAPGVVETINLIDFYIINLYFNFVSSFQEMHSFFQIDFFSD